MDEHEMSDEMRAHYHDLVQKIGVEYSSGSRRELEMVVERFKGSGHKYVNVYLIADDWDENEGLGNDKEQEELVPVGERSKGKKYYITRTERHEPQSRKEPGDLRYLAAWVKEQQRLMRGDNNLPSPREFIRHYYFQKMIWHGRLIREIYYNLDAGKVYLRLGDHHPPKSALPKPPATA